MRISQYLIAMTGLSYGVGSSNQMMRADVICDQISRHGRYSPSLIDIEIKRLYAENWTYLVFSALVTIVSGLAFLFGATSAWLAALGAIWLYMGVRTLVSLFFERNASS